MTVREQRNPSPVIVAGGGAAGLMAAAEAAQAGCRVLLFEKMPSPGRKLLITGNGRCNVTNACDTASLADHFFSGGRFLRGSLSRFSNRELISLLRRSGIDLVEEPEGKLFPASGQASDILDFLVRRALAAGVSINTGEAVRSINVTHATTGGRRRVLSIITDKRTLEAGQVILAMGGRSWPWTGSSGDGTRLAAALGHRIAPERPALVPLIVPDPALHALQGVALRDVGLTLRIDGKDASQTKGDLLFTHFGVSGPAALRLSRLISDPFPSEPVDLVMDCLPETNPETVDLQIQNLLSREPRRKLRNMLPGLFADRLPGAFVPHLLRLAGLDENMDGRGITRSQRQLMVASLKGCRLPVAGTRGWREAIVTAGGVDLKEVDPRTMASRLVDGLYFAGEILDIDADTGGYNLQAAWSTGAVAGRAAALHCLSERNLI